ncbi:thioesterase II family protein [Lachnotalea glycerini]|uniref:Thioesterase n=1 Tax=Lachnotalea glycerini TaxID=1763509 RepID=A0A371JC63_9FIRM|nr:thioesterase domain-containing protein [Lachnotalea glycerini]RDY30278.1 thioesterase [Lachnotalea glycerini]
MNTKKVICLPHAGGMAVSYKCFEKYADDNIQFINIELPGHGTRCDENLCNSLEEIVEDIYFQIQDEIYKEDYVILGHSMGSWLAYELYYKIKEENNTLPLQLFLSGNTSPFYERKEGTTTLLSDDEFIENIIKKGLTAKEIFQNDELRAIFLPVLKSDFIILENYKPDESRALIECGITVMGGLQDTSMGKKIEAWKSMTSKEYNIYYFEGDHFYLFYNAEEMVEIITRTFEISNNM